MTGKPPSRTSSAESGGRYAAIDCLKAAAVIAVAFQHAGHPKFMAPWEPAEIALRQAWTAFHVPTFIAVSGFLYHRPSAIPLADVARRLARLLGPYLVASLVVIALGMGHPEYSAAFQIASGSAIGIYYFVFLLATLIAALPLISRLPPWSLWALVLLSIGQLIAVTLDPTLLWGWPYFWRPRNPFMFFHLGYFLLGWLAARNVERLGPLARRNRIALYLVGGVAIGAWGLVQVGVVAESWLPLSRVPFALAVIVAISLAVRGRRVPPLVRFLSDASLGIFLYHHAFQLWAMPHVRELDAGVRVLTLAGIGLVGAGLVCGVGRFIDPTWSRRILGA